MVNTTLFNSKLSIQSLREQISRIMHLAPGDSLAIEWLLGKFFLEKPAPEAPHECFAFIAWIMAQTADGHTVADLSEFDEDITRRWQLFQSDNSSNKLEQVGPNDNQIDDEEAQPSKMLPSYLQFQPVELIKKYPQLFGTGNHPFIVANEGMYVYLNRYYKLENRFIQAIKTAAQSDEETGRDLAAVRKHVKRALPHELTAEQKAAWTSALRNKFAIICGGPGTGKTTLVVAILMGYVYDFLQHKEISQPNKYAGLRICIAAPTGRAAFRVLESIRSVMAQAGDALLLSDYLPNSCFTVHKLLGLGHGRSPRYHAGNPLPYDVVVLDEASMMDMQLMTLLLEAKAPSTRLLVIGDPDQLPSVDTGAVLHNLTRPPEKKKHILANRTSFLTVGHRSQGEVRDFVAAVSEENKELFWDFIAKAQSRGLGAVATDIGIFAGPPNSETIDSAFQEFFPVNYLQELCAPACAAAEVSQWADSLRSAFAITNGLAVLTPFRRGRLGSDELNEYFLRKFFKRGIRLSPGVPLLITRNDYELELFNGDRGITVAFNDGLYAVFPRYAQQARSDGDREEFNRVPLERLQHVEPAFVTTVHKSQGSEYEQVLFLLPPGREEPVGRQLVYTAMTRARKRLILAADPDQLWSALGRPQLRRSGVVAQLTR